MDDDPRLQTIERSMNRDYRICVKCIMDTTDREIQFDSRGVCNHCRQYDELVASERLTPELKKAKFEQILLDIKSKGKNKEYDCIIGVSGGVDSTYVAYLTKQYGLRPLAIHLDNGWDSELAVKNIETFLKKLSIDLYTYVLDWEDFKDLQLSFLKASVSDAEIPTDHAIFAVLWKAALERNVPILNGNNTVTEGVLPSSWTYGISDWRYISSVHKRFGKTKLKNFPHYTRNDLYYYTFIRGIKSTPILDYIPYRKSEVMDVLQGELGWRYYGGKHYESIYTRFFQGYILPTKFNIDKRKAHLSNLICSGQLSRDAALTELETNGYSEGMMREDRDYVVKKLGITEAEFEAIMKQPIKTHADYPTYKDRLPTDPLRQLMLMTGKGAVRTIRKFSPSFAKP